MPENRGKGREKKRKKDDEDLFNKKGPFEVVILFRWTDPGRDRARALKLMMKHAGFNCFLALDNMVGGQYVKESIQRAIKQCMCVLVVLTDDVFNEGSYVLRELKWVFGYGKKVVPIFGSGFD